MPRRATTLLEIIVAMLILSIVMVGTVNHFVSGKRFVFHIRSRMSGGELGGIFLSPLQMSVRQDTWLDAANPLATGERYCDDDGSHTQQPNCPSFGERTLDGVTYYARYNIGDVNGTTLRKVVLTLNWTEPSF